MHAGSERALLPSRTWSQRASVCSWPNRRSDGTRQSTSRGVQRCSSVPKGRGTPVVCTRPSSRPKGVTWGRLRGLFWSPYCGVSHGPHDDSAQTGDFVTVAQEQKTAQSEKGTLSRATAVQALPERIYTPPSGWFHLNLRELWEYRELLYFLVWRDIKVRYKQTVLGVAWAVLQPLLTMAVFTVFFGVLGRISSEGLPYPIFFYSALVPWTYFNSCLRRSSDSLVGSASLVSKIYFPRLILPLASVLSSLVDFGFAFVVLLVLMFFYHMVPTWAILLLPVYLLLALITALGAGLWLSALNVRYRDFAFVVPFLIQIWFFVTPVIYPSSLVPEPWHTWYGLNPMVGVVEGFRQALLSTSSSPGPLVWVSVLVSVVLLVSGAYFFRRMEHTFADVV